MPMTLFVSAVLTGAYTCWLLRVHIGKVTPWLGTGCFLIVGAFGALAAFSAVNLFLSYTSTDRESAGWFQLFAVVSGILAAVIGLIAAGFVWVFWERLQIKPLIAGLLVLTHIEFLVLTGCAGMPLANWW